MAVLLTVFFLAAESFRTEEVTRVISREPGGEVLETAGNAASAQDPESSRFLADTGDSEGEEGKDGKDGTEENEASLADNRKIALTFDDGPHPVYTPRLLDGLKERGVKASFFVVGQNAEQNPELIQRIQEEGHLLGNHTYSHVQLTGITEEEACEELVRTSEVVEKITGEHLEYVRPPFGSWNDELDCDILMIPVFWSVDSRDWTTTNVSEIVRRVVTQTKEDDIILMHDYYSTSVDAALKIVDQMMEMGFEFVTADELIVN